MDWAFAKGPEPKKGGKANSYRNFSGQARNIVKVGVLSVVLFEGVLLCPKLISAGFCSVVFLKNS
jgi:hypothetical protein